MKYELKNEDLALGIDSLGAEMIYLTSSRTEQNYLWNRDEKFWKRSSPILFPSVGTMRNQQYSYQKKVYSMPQHGFARDMEFDCISENAEEIWFQTEANAKTREYYPFEFKLKIGYRLEKNDVTVMWTVVNDDDKDTLYFSIGAHPAFACPLKDGEKQSEYSVWMNARNDGVLFSHINKDALMYNYKNELHLSKGRHPLAEGFFDEGAYIIEDYQVSQVSLVNPENKPYVTVSFDAPLFGLWSPEKKNAPFVCIEPWYGRCDRATYDGPLQTREWGNKLAPGKEFKRQYTITIDP
ncbi:aldose 1-epimerase family protein [Lachnospiraceae bacterium ZAX-1]